MKRRTTLIGYICIAFCVGMSITGYYVNAVPQQLAEENAIGERIEYSCPNDTKIVRIQNLTNDSWELHAYNITNYYPYIDTVVFNNGSMSFVLGQDCTVTSMYNIYSWQDKMVIVNATEQQHGASEVQELDIN